MLEDLKGTSGQRRLFGGLAPIRWLDDHFEEALLILLLIMISCVELAQVVARNVPFMPSLTWAEEFCRFAWVATVFLSLPYTIRTATTLRVTALLEVLPWKVQNVMNFLADVFTFAVLAVLSWNAVGVLQGILASDETSPAMMMPMWIMYAIVLAGFALGALRSVQMAVVHARHLNVPPPSSVELQAELEIAAELRAVEASLGKDAETSEGGRA